MAGLQTEVIGDPGSDCGTTFTLEYDFEESDIPDFQNRFIDVNGTKTLLTRENASKFVGRKIHLYSPFGCIGVGKNHECLCEKCAGIQTSKYVGLNSNKVATVLTNLNMKKFHDSTLRFNKIKPDDIDEKAFGLDQPSKVITFETTTMAMKMESCCKKCRR